MKGRPPNVAMFMIDDGGDVHPMHLHPGVWMDHCDNLADAAQGMVAHLMYAG